MNDITYGLFSNDQNKKLLPEFPDLIEFPAIEIEFPEAPISSPDRFDWIVFSDINAVEGFLRSVKRSGFDLFDLDQVRVCACGESIADRLRFDHLHADIIPARNSPEVAFEAISSYESLDGLSFLLINENDALAGMLNEAGAGADRVNAYRIIENEGFSKMKALLRGGAIDSFIISSPNDLYSLDKLIPLSSLDLEFIALDSNCYQAAIEFGLKCRLHIKK